MKLIDADDDRIVSFDRALVFISRVLNLALNIPCLNRAQCPAQRVNLIQVINYALFNLGVSADFGGITGFVYGTASAARGDSNYYAITVGIRAPL